MALAKWKGTIFLNSVTVKRAQAATVRWRAGPVEAGAPHGGAWQQLFLAIASLAFFFQDPSFLCPELNSEISVLMFKLQLSFTTKNHLPTLGSFSLYFCL